MALNRRAAGTRTRPHCPREPCSRGATARQLSRGSAVRPHTDTDHTRTHAHGILHVYINYISYVVRTLPVLARRARHKAQGEALACCCGQTTARLGEQLLPED